MTRLTSSQQAWERTAREFAEEHIAPISIERDLIADPRQTFDWNVIERGSQLGFRTAVVPRQHGGEELDHVSQVLVMSELAKGDSAIAKTFSQCWKWSGLIAEAGTPDQRTRFLEPFVRDHRFLLGSASTEEHSGSDNRTHPNELRAGWSLRAERDGDWWTLNGRKRYIANGTVAKLFFVGARTDPTVHVREGGTLFLVPSDAPGFHVGKVYDKIGWRFYQNAELVFDNVKVPHANVVGEVNGAYAVRQEAAALEFSEIELSSNALGVCDAALQMAMDHARSRWQGGSYLIDHQAIQLKLAEMHKLTEALRSFVMRVAAEADELGSTEPKTNRLAVNFATDAIQRVTHLNMEVHGGAGVMKDVGAEKLVRDASIWTHLAGDAVQRFKVIKYL